jgi:hypothetical protein
MATQPDSGNSKQTGAAVIGSFLDCSCDGRQAVLHIKVGQRVFKQAA